VYPAEALMVDENVQFDFYRERAYLGEDNSIPFNGSDKHNGV
jgi:hypothetical protein